MVKRLSLRRSPVHKALARTNYVFGAEREPALMVGLLSFTLMFVGMTWPTFFAGLIFWSIGTKALQMAAKSHPMMTQVYVRSLNYRRYYSANERLTLPKPWSGYRAK